MKQKNTFFKIILPLSLFFLLARLAQLQIFAGEKYKQLAENNRIRQIKIKGPRGIIFDRHGEILAENQPVFKIEEGNSDEVVSRDEALRLQAEGRDENLFIDYLRSYPQGEVFGHVTGYLGQLSEAEVQSEKCPLRPQGEASKAQNCELSDWVGRTGIEEYYETKLRGKDGGELVEVDTLGKILRRMGREEPLPGENLSLALDADLQRVAALQMAGKKGAVVATNPQTGEVLLLYSSPSFNPNYFLSPKFSEAVSRLINDKENQPLFNRVVAGLYPPGSTFKIVTATAALEEGKITKNTLINDPGVIYVGSYRYSNWYFTGYGRTEGDINIIRAIKRSTDTFFYKVGEMVGVADLTAWAKKFGLNKTTDIDLGGEVPGFVPDEEWKKEATGEGWFLGNTYHLAIGQGDLALTPLDVNLMTGVVANEGKICRPRMLKVAGEPIKCQEIGVKSETLKIIKEGMVEACSSGGTAYPFFDFKPKVACKTGTAEYVASDGKMKTHAWFSAFAPSEDPTIVVTVLVEGGGEGSSVAAPIAKEILKEFFKVR